MPTSSAAPAHASATASPAPAPPAAWRRRRKSGQPIDSASTPASGPTQTRPTDANALNSANCVAVKRWLHSAIRQRDEGRRAHAAGDVLGRDHQQQAAVHRRGLRELHEPQVERRDREPRQLPLPRTASHQKPTLLAICRTPNSISARHSPSLQHQRAAEQRAADREPQADDLVDHADFGRAEVPSPAAGTASSASRRTRRRACTAR